MDSTQHGDRSVEKETGEGDEVQPRYRLGQPLVVFGQPPESRCPRKGTLYDPPARQKHKALFSAGVFDHLQLDVPLASASANASSPV